MRNRFQEVARNNHVLGHFIIVHSPEVTYVLCLYPYRIAFPVGRKGTKSVFNLKMILIKIVFKVTALDNVGIVPFLTEDLFCLLECEYKAKYVLSA